MGKRKDVESDEKDLIIQVLRAEKEQYKAENELLRLWVERLREKLAKDRGVVLIPYEGLVH